MRRALRMAKKGWGQTNPNPMVGAVLVRDGREIAAGFHARAGLPHAEIEALRRVGDAARGAALFVTLEPCSTHGRTPPCTQAILDAGIRRVVIGCLDPNPQHAGAAVGMMRTAGVEVTVGVEEASCRSLNEAFFSWITRRRPFVVLKLAMTLDGKIATAGGQSRWISGEPARRFVQRLRQWSDAIMVGGGTARQDNPSLTVRTPQNWAPQPRRIVWSRDSHLPRDLHVWDDAAAPPIVAAPDSTAQWLEFLRALGGKEVTALLIEGGGELAASALRAKIVDKVLFFLAPKILGGRGSRPAVGGPDPGSLEDALPLQHVRTRRVGSDILVTGYPADVHRPD
jgi:diaminohydroxyphosphoribosylaminopyrimidine deaminase/5-amino-6-(5-phosphoribosylamino)uracil reductase